MFHYYFGPIRNIMICSFFIYVSSRLERKISKYHIRFWLCKNIFLFFFLKNRSFTKFLNIIRLNNLKSVQQELLLYLNIYIYVVVKLGINYNPRIY